MIAVGVVGVVDAVALGGVGVGRAASSRRIELGGDTFVCVQRCASRACACCVKVCFWVKVVGVGGVGGVGGVVVVGVVVGYGVGECCYGAGVAPFNSSTYRVCIARPLQPALVQHLRAKPLPPPPSR